MSSAAEAMDALAMVADAPAWISIAASHSRIAFALVYDSGYDQILWVDRKRFLKGFMLGQDELRPLTWAEVMCLAPRPEQALCLADALALADRLEALPEPPYYSTHDRDEP